MQTNVKPINVLRVQPVYTESCKFCDRLHYSVTLVQINFSTDECFTCATRLHEIVQILWQIAVLSYTGPDKFFNRWMFCLCNSFAQNRANSITDARSIVYRIPTYIKIGWLSPGFHCFNSPKPCTVQVFTRGTVQVKKLWPSCDQTNNLHLFSVQKLSRFRSPHVNERGIRVKFCPLKNLFGPM